MSAGLFVRAFGENFGLVFEFSDEFTVCEPWVRVDEINSR